MSTDRPEPDDTERERYWRRNLSLTCGLLVVWLTLILVTALFARNLNHHTFLGIPLAFYVFAQGAPILFLVIIGVHARIMNRLDRRLAERPRIPIEKIAVR